MITVAFVRMRYRLRTLLILLAVLPPILASLSMTIAMVSHHLQILRRANIVATQKSGRFVVYRLHPDAFAESDCLDLGCCKLRLPAKEILRRST